MSEKHRIKDYGVWIKGKGIKAVGSESAGENWHGGGGESPLRSKA